MDSARQLTGGIRPESDSVSDSRLDRSAIAAVLSTVSTPREKLICLHLATTTAAAPRELSDELGLPLTAVLPLLGRLEDRGLIDRTDEGVRLSASTHPEGAVGAGDGHQAT